MQNERLIAMGGAGRVRVVSGPEGTRVEATAKDMQPVYAHLYSARGEKLTVPLMYGRGSAAVRFEARSAILESADGRLMTGGFAGSAKLRESALNRVFCEMEERRRLAAGAKPPPDEAAKKAQPTTAREAQPPTGRETEHSDALNEILKRAAKLFGETGDTPQRDPFPGRFAGASWRTVERPGANCGYLEGSFKKDGVEYAVYAVPGERSGAQSIHASPQRCSAGAPHTASGRPRFERDYLGRGYWIRIKRKS